MSELTFATMCQGSRLLGMSSKNEKLLESYFRKIVVNNGMDYAIAQLKTLKQHTVRKLENPHYKLPTDYFTTGEQPLSWQWSLDRPNGPLSVIYKTWTKPSTRIRGIGALINSFKEDTPSRKQIKKLIDGVNSRSESNGYVFSTMTREDAAEFVRGVRHQRQVQKPIDGTDLTGSLLPFGNFTEDISDVRKGLISDDPAVRHKAIATLSHALDGQWQDAPRVVTNYLRTEIPSYKGIKVKAKDTGVIARDYEYSAKYKTYGRHINDDYAGTVSFLQKPGGKLRSVFNTNRVVNVAMEPYAKGLERAFYRRYPHNIFVGRQGKGKEAIQQMLRRGYTLTSADLTSATDLLDFRVFTNSLRSRIWNLMGRTPYYTSSHLDGVKDGSQVATYEGTQRTLREYEKGGQLSNILDKHVDIPGSRDLTVRDCIHALKAINVFERTAEMPFYSKDLDTALALRTGQPLGMFGSFQTLTAMNFCMGREAYLTCRFGGPCNLKQDKIFSSAIPKFAVVGDDFVGEDSFMGMYSSIVRWCNGEDNHEKALHSNVYAEFLSHLMTKRAVIDIKPKFRLGTSALWINAEKTSINKVDHVYRLSKSDKQSLSMLAAIQDPSGAEYRAMGTPKRLPRDKRVLLEASLKRLSLEGSDKSGEISVSQETIQLSRDTVPVDVKYAHSELDFRRRQKDSTYKVQRPIDAHKDDDEHYSPVTERFDHKRNKRVPVDELKLKNVAEQKKRRAKIASDLLDTLDNNVEHYFSLPHHRDSKISATSVLLDAVQSVEDSSSSLGRDIYPSASEYNSRRNPVDRSKQFEKHMKFAYSSKVNNDTLTYRMSRFLVSCRYFDSIDISTVPKDERDRALALSQLSKGYANKLSPKLNSLMDKAAYYARKGDKSLAEDAWTRSLASALVSDPTSYHCIDGFGKTQGVSPTAIKQQLDGIWHRQISSSTETNTYSLGKHYKL